ncbi:hypothetical protein D6D28_10105 [Aureobasidium pullulans]|uniref:non-specific serine/threonine protein kinase n=1 Tax=Aureobasidium pullulans TaxID=5580 RepID=A0A4S8S185_AURPU|nr:hypothetical protein D6D28_10105 [Aureobasidium pullulans]
MNHEKYEERLAFVRSLLQQEFVLEVSNIEPIAYDADCPFAYNNFLYRVDVKNHGKHYRDQQPCSSTIPADASQLVLRLSNNASGIPPVNRVENEVGMMNLFREALRDSHSAHLIPEVYGWGSAEYGQGWILQEFKVGVPLDEFYQTLPGENKPAILEQMAEVLVAMQKYKLPESIKLLGGVSSSDDGHLVCGPLTTLSAGPFRTYTQLYQAMLQQQVTSSDESPILQGWQEDGIRARLEKFSLQGIAQITEEYAQSPRAIVHSDFTMNNVLVDPATKRISALVDFDWSFVGSPGDEFLRSFFDLGGIPGPDSEGEELTIRQAILHGFEPEHVFNGPLGQLQAWYQALEKYDALVPSRLSGTEQISELHHFINQIAPWLLTHEVPLRRRSKEQLESVKANTKKTLLAFLEKHGF